MKQLEEKLFYLYVFHAFLFREVIALLSLLPTLLANTFHRCSFHVKCSLTLKNTEMRTLRYFR